MGKYTVTMFEYFKSEFQHMGLSEISSVKNGVNIIDPHGLGFINRMIAYDNETQLIMDNKLYHGAKFTNVEADINFKKAFLNRFLNREIKFQTIEVFSGKLISMSLEQDLLISKYFSSDLEKYLDSTSESNNNNDSVSDNRNIVSTLPQSEINLSLEDPDLTYADNNTISKQKNTSNGTSSNSNYSLSNLNELYKMRNMILDDFDTKLFLQIW